jgi:hypothetical protein
MAIELLDELSELGTMADRLTSYHQEQDRKGAKS